MIIFHQSDKTNKIIFLEVRKVPKTDKMPKGKVLDEKEKGMVEAYKQEGVSLREIARRLGRSDKVIRNYIKNPENYGTIKRRPKISKLSARDKRDIAKLASNSTKSLSQIKNELKLEVSKETIRKALHENPNIIRSKMNTAPNLSPQHKERRLEFAKLNMARQWDNVSNY